MYKIELRYYIMHCIVFLLNHEFLIQLKSKFVKKINKNTYSLES